MKKRIISIFLSIMVCFLSFYFVCPVDVLAAGNNKRFNWETMDRDKWGPGKSYEECTEAEKSYRNSQLWGQFFNDISKGALYILNLACPGVGNLAADAFSGLESYLVRFGAIRSGATTYKEYLIRQAGLGYLLDKDFGDNMPTPGNLEMNFSPDLLNYIQGYVNEVKENETGVVTAFCIQPTTQSAICSSTHASISDAYYISMYMKDIINTHGFCIYNQYRNGSGNWCHSVIYFDGGINDYYLYGRNGSLVSYTGSNERSDNVCIRSKDGESFNCYIKEFNFLGKLSKDKPLITVECNGVYSGHTQSDGPYVNGGVVYNHPFNCPISSNYIGCYFVTSYDHFQMYKSAGWVDTTKDFGAVIPSIIQATNAIKEWTESQTVTGNDIINYYNTYDYSRIINEIGDTSNFDQQELQNKIDEIFARLQESIEHGNDISEESNSWLSKIYDKLKDIEDKIGSGGGGVISDIADFVHWSELQLKLDAIIANLTSIRKDVDDISDNQSDMDALLNKLDQESQGLANKAKSKFPFCIPWDMLILYKSLEAMPQVPTFNWTLTIPSWGIEEEFTIDLSNFEIVAKISRYFFDIIFFMALCKLGLSMSGYSFSIEKT